MARFLPSLAAIALGLGLFVAGSTPGTLRQTSGETFDVGCVVGNSGWARSQRPEPFWKREGFSGFGVVPAEHEPRRFRPSPPPFSDDIWESLLVEDPMLRSLYAR